MEHLITPAGYKPVLDLRETQVAIKEIKDFFQRELAKQLNLSYDKTLAELNRAMNRGYLVNCYLNQSGEAAIILTNITAADNYVTVICPNCGGSNQVRAGFSGVCSYCNSPLSGK